MIQKLILTAIFSICFLANCNTGGGWGVYYPPQISINEIGITKEEIQKSKINENATINVHAQEQLTKHEEYIQFKKYYYFRSFNFLGKQYRVGIPLNQWVSIVDSANNIVLKLELPRYSTNAAAIELVGKNGKKYLAVYVNQQSTSHSSTLFLISDDWRVLYKEHLLGGEWISKAASEYGDDLIVSAETEWFQNEKCVSVGGPWKYNIFKAQ